MAFKLPSLILVQHSIHGVQSYLLLLVSLLITISKLIISVESSIFYEIFRFNRISRQLWPISCLVYLLIFMGLIQFKLYVT